VSDPKPIDRFGAVQLRHENVWCLEAVRLGQKGAVRWRQGQANPPLEGGDFRLRSLFPRGQLLLVPPADSLASNWGSVKRSSGQFFEQSHPLGTAVGLPG
jgi:hypothetical protein